MIKNLRNHFAMMYSSESRFLFLFAKKSKSSNCLIVKDDMCVTVLKTKTKFKFGALTIITSILHSKNKLAIFCNSDHDTE